MHKLSLSLDRCDLKFAKDEARTFEGYLSVWGRVDSYGDTVHKGAFEETLAERKRMPPMFLNHDSWGLPVGVWKAMDEDDVGLRVVGELTPGSSVANDVYASMKHGAISGLSIGFRTIESKENDHGGRDLFKVHLVEGSIVTMPAEDAARIDSVKAALAAIESISDCEQILRDAGLSRTEAKTFLARLKDITVRDAPGFEAENAALKARVQWLESRVAGAAWHQRMKASIQK